MEDLRSVMRDLRRLAMVQLRDQARVRHQVRIRGENPADVLPEHDLPRAKGAGQKSRRQIGSPASERRRASVGSLPDEAGNDGRRARGEERPQRTPGASSGLGKVRRGAAVLCVGRHDAAGIHVLRPAS